MRKYSPPPKFDRHGHCGCEQGTLYVSNQYFLPLYLCSSCGFAGHDTEKRTIDTEGGYQERKMHLNLIERMWAWLGVRAPKAVRSDGPSNQYQSVMKDAAAVVRRWREEKGTEKK
jgi:hypothetical protein